MKKFYTLFILILIYSQTVKAQGYYPMLDSVANRWYYTENILPLSPQNTPVAGAPCSYGSGGFFGTSFQLYTSGDTLINNLIYKILLQGQYSSPFYCVYGYLREDTTASKIYFIDNIFSPEELLYDFSMQVGDTMTLNFQFTGGYWQNGVYTLDSIVTGQILAGSRNVFYLNCHNCPGSRPMIWIESVGNPGDLIYSRSANFFSFGWFSVCQQTTPTGFPYDFIQILTCFEHVPKVYFDSCAHQEAVTNGCLYYADSCNYWNICGSVEELGFVKSFSVSPNPATDEITISMETNKKTETTFIIRDITGKEINRSKTNTILSGNKSFNLSIHNLEKGIYIIECSMKEGSLYRKLIVQ